MVLITGLDLCTTEDDRAVGSSEYRRDLASPADRVPIGASKNDSPWLKKGLALNMETGMLLPLQHISCRHAI